MKIKCNNYFIINISFIQNMNVDVNNQHIEDFVERESMNDDISKFLKFLVKRRNCLKKPLTEDFEKDFFYFQKGDKLRESDSIAILPEYKTILITEIKNSKNLSMLKEASKQSNNHKEVFNLFFGRKLTKDWQIVTVAYITKLDINNVQESKRPCDNCKPFILNDNRSVNFWC